MNTATAQVFTLPEREFQQAIAELLGRQEYARVLDAVRFARERDPKNIFLIAIDRQVRRLQELILSDDPEIEERAKTRESLAQLIQRAWADATTRGVVLTLPAGAVAAEVHAAPPPQPVPATPAAATPVPPAPVPAAAQASPAPTAQPSRRSSISTVAAAVLTLIVIGLAVTYFVTRKAHVPEAPTLVAARPAAEQPPPEAGPAEPRVAETPAQQPPVTVETPRSTVRERQRTVKSVEATVSEPAARKPTAPAVPPADRRDSRSEPKQAVAGLVSPPSKEAAAEAQPSTESTEPFIPVQKEPRVIRLVEPELGESALRFTKEGEVVARVLIGPDGKALKVRIVKTTNAFLNRAVAEALLKSEYEPGVMTAGPVQSWLTVPFKFR